MKSIITLFLALTLVSLKAQMTPEEVVQKQLESYNNGDIDAFMSVIAEDITIYEFSNGEIIIKGDDDCKKFYTNLFKDSPSLHSKILTRTVFENKVIDHEYITGRNGNSTPVELILIYEVGDEKITKITVIRGQG